MQHVISMKMSNKHAEKKKLGEQIYNNTAAEYDLRKYRKNIAANWLSIHQKKPPENYTPTVIQSEKHRSKSQQVPRGETIPSPIDNSNLNFDNYDPFNDFLDEENQFEFGEDQRPMATNKSPKSTLKRKHDNKNVGHSGKQKKRPHNGDYPVEKKSKTRPSQVPVGSDFELIPRESRHLPTTTRKKLPDLNYTPIRPFPRNNDEFEQFSPPACMSDNRQRKMDHRISANFHKMGKERERALLENGKNDNKRSSEKKPHPNRFQNIEKDFDMSPSIIIESRYHFNSEIPRERKQQRSIQDEIEDDFSKSFDAFDVRKRNGSVQKTEKQILSAEKSLVKAERAADRRLRINNNDSMAILNRYMGHNIVPAPRPIGPHSILPKQATQPIVYNIKCNNLIIKTDYPSDD